MKDRWYNAALNFVNEVRSANDLPELDELERGWRVKPSYCPVSNSITKDGPEVFFVSTVPYFHSDFGNTEFSGIVRVQIVENGAFTANDVLRLPIDVSHFVRRFDRGYYKELDAGYNTNDHQE